MKKKLLILASLLIIVLVAFFTFFATMFSSDKLLKENIAALADDPAISWIDDDDAGVNKFDEVTCGTFTYKDPTTGDIIEIATKLCSGSGNKKCKCP